MQILKKQKAALPYKISRLSLRLKSSAFMKIFMYKTKSPQRFQKIRHYDLERQGATAIAACLKNKLQQIFLRYFFDIKNFKRSLNSSKTHEYPQSVQLFSLKSQSHLTKPVQRSRCQTDREAYQNGKLPSSKSQFGNLNEKKTNLYKSQYGGQTQKSQSSRKSNLESLLDKVRQVNSQSKLQKQYPCKNDNYPVSYENSRIASSTGYSKKLPKNISHLQEYYKSSNDLSFCTLGGHKQKYMVKNSKMNPPIDRTNFYINIEKQESLDKSNLLSLKKWHRNEKRNVIMSKIMQLENSLLVDESRGEQYFYSDIENVGSQLYPDCTYITPSNYSQAYLNGRTRQPVKSVIDVRVANNHSRGYKRHHRGQKFNDLN